MTQKRLCPAPSPTPTATLHLAPGRKSTRKYGSAPSAKRPPTARWSSTLDLAGEHNLNDKILIDLANPLGFSKGWRGLGSNTDSPGEQIQRRFPEAKVVKTLHTMNANLMVDPAQLAGADHTVFVSGNDSEATDTDLGRHHYRAGYRDSAPSLVAALRCATEARLQLQDRPLIRDCVLTEQYLPTA